MAQTLKDPRLEALERQVELLRAAIKETWDFIKYQLPLSVEIEVAKQSSLKKVIYNQKGFKPLLNAVLNEATKILQETNEPVHYTVIVEMVKKNHADLLAHWNKPNLDGKVRDLASQGYLVRVGKGMYFYGPKLSSVEEHSHGM